MEWPMGRGGAPNRRPRSSPWDAGIPSVLLLHVRPDRGCASLRVRPTSEVLVPAPAHRRARMCGTGNPSSEPSRRLRLHSTPPACAHRECVAVMTISSKSAKSFVRRRHGGVRGRRRVLPGPVGAGGQGRGDVRELDGLRGRAGAGAPAPRRALRHRRRPPGGCAEGERSDRCPPRGQALRGQAVFRAS